MITAFDPTFITDYQLDDEEENPTIFKLKGLSGRNWIRYKGLVDSKYFSELDEDSFKEYKKPNKAQLAKMAEVSEIMNKHYAANIEATDFLLEKGLVGWKNFGAKFDEKTKIDYLSDQAYMQISAKICNLSQITEEEAKK